MKIFGYKLQREERSDHSIENPKIAVSSEDFMQFFGMQSGNLPTVTIDKALQVPAVFAAVSFLSRTLAALPLNVFQSGEEGAVRIREGIGAVVSSAWTPEMNGFKARQFFWKNVFTGGRGLAWIERSNGIPINIWPMNPSKTTVRRLKGKLIYTHENNSYESADVIDLAFLLKDNLVGHYGPISQASKAIQLALAMNDYASNFFAGGGVPPLALTGPLPVGPAAMKRAMDDMNRSIANARSSDSPVIPIPPGYELKQVGFDPAKGQMTDARLFQIQEIARTYQIPPAFLQDLSRGTFSNVEQQDLHLVKHLIGQWAKAFESEANLKLFGRRNEDNLYAEHNLDGLMRGDFRSRIDGIARGVQTGQLTPNEARALENRPRHSNSSADDLLVQGATVPLGTQLRDIPRTGREDTGESDEHKNANG